MTNYIKFAIIINASHEREYSFPVMHDLFRGRKMYELLDRCLLETLSQFMGPLTERDARALQVLQARGEMTTEESVEIYWVLRAHFRPRDFDPRDFMSPDQILSGRDLSVGLRNREEEDLQWCLNRGITP